METVQINSEKVSVYQNFATKLENKSLMEIFQTIKSDAYQADINSIRYAIHKGDNSTADKIKNGLLGFTASGTFGTSRTKANITTYSQIVGLDFDHIPLSEIQQVVTMVNECEYTFASFISPSGEGIKVFIKIDSNAAQHTIAYNQVANFYKNSTGFDFDAKCKDITRLCFVSYDTNLYLNESATIFLVQEEVKPTKPKAEIQNTLSTDDLLDKCLHFTEQKQQYAVGSRNAFIHLFASNANRYGIYEADTINYCITNFDLEVKEITTTIKSTYKNQIADFAKFANLQTCKVQYRRKKKILL